MCLFSKIVTFHTTWSPDPLKVKFNNIWTQKIFAQFHLQYYKSQETHLLFFIGAHKSDIIGKVREKLKYVLKF